MYQHHLPKVSVCVMCYNQAPFIRQCLDSILQQVVEFSVEILVADDSSTDGTSDIVLEYARKFPDRLRPLIQTYNIGGTANYLNVHLQARGEYVCPCDGDDYWLPGKLARQVSFMDENPSVVQTWHRQYLVDASSEKFGVFPPHFPDSIFGKPLSFDDLAHSYGLVGQHSSQMYRRAARSIFERDRPTIDYFYALDFASKGLSLHLPEFLGCYRCVPNGSITQQSSGRDTVDLALLDAAVFYATKRPTCQPAFKANLLVRMLGARFRKRKHWRQLFDAARRYPFSLFSFMRSLHVFLAHRL